MIRPHFRSFPAAVLLLLGVVLGFPAHASWMVPPAPDRPKDFTILKRDGLYHLFYIRNNPNASPGSTQVDFGHATSADLYFWDSHPPVVPTRPGHFDRSHVWAPSIVQRDGVYWMFYTGVSDSGGDVSAQRIGVATSVDLENWNALDDPVLTGNAVSWAWWDSTQATPFRDPFVMSDPTTPGRWLMYYSTAPASDHDGMIVGAATSDGDFTHWSDLQPLWITQRQNSFNAIVESPHLFQHDGLWWLFFTTNSGQPISYATSATSPIAPLEQWTYRGRLANMLNLNTLGWFASEYLKDGLVDYFCFVNGDRVEVSRMVWQTSTKFSLQQPDLFHVRTLLWQEESTHEDSTAYLAIAAKWWAGHTLDLESFWIDSTATWHSIPNSLIGLPAHIPLTADVTLYPWIVRAPPDSTGAPDSVQIVMRTLDQTAVSNPIWVVRPSASSDPDSLPPLHVTSLTWEEPVVNEDSTVTLEILAKGWSGQTLDLESFWIDDAETLRPIPDSLIGLPAHIPLTGHVTLYPWLAHAPPDSTGAPDSVRIVVRTVDQSAVSNPIWVVRAPDPDSLLPFHVSSLLWQQASAHEDSSATLRIVAKGWPGHTLDLESFWVDSTDTWRPIADSLIGLPPEIPLTANVTLFPWTVHAPPDSTGAPDSVQIVVRTLDQSAVSNGIWVVRAGPADTTGASFHVSSLTWNKASVRQDSTACLEVVAQGWTGHTLDLESFWIDSTAAWHSIPDTLIGLSSHIALSDSVTLYAWHAHAPPESTGAPDSVRIVVRTADSTAVSNVIWVVRPARGPPSVPSVGLEEPDHNPQPILRPFKDGVMGAPAALLVNLPEEREAKLDVFDLQGRRVRRLAERRLPVGATVIGWDGRDSGGRRLSNGLYFVRLVTPQETRTVRIILR